LRRAGTGVLALVVLIGTTAGFLALSRVFGGDAPLGSGGSGRIAFGRAQRTESPEGVVSASQFEIWSMAADGSDRRPVRTDAVDATTPAWSPDGSRIAFLERVPQTDDLGTLRLVTTAPDGSDLRVVADGLIDPIPRVVAWSPDGGRIAVLDTRTHDLGAFDDFGLPLTEIAVYSLDGTREPLVDVPGIAMGFTWWPDGRGFAVVRMDEQGDRDLVRVDLEGEILGSLVRDVAIYPPAVSPTGDRVAFVRQEPLIGDSDVTTDDVWTVRANGTDIERVTDDAGSKPTVAWTPDGSRILFASLTPDRCDVVSVLPNGSDRRVVADRQAMGGCAEGISISGPATPSTEDEPDTVTEEGRDIGLGVRMCDLEVIDDIDWDGTGIDGAAWTGAPVDEDGHCSTAPDVQHVVAVDRDGDGVADQGGTSTLRSCLLCQPFATVDLNEDGVLELVVLDEASSTPTYSLYEVNRPGSERAPGVYPIFVVPPGAPAMNLDPNEPTRITVGDDEGFSGSVECEDASEGPPILRYTWVRGAVDAETDLDVDITRLSFGEDGVFHIESVDSFRVPRDPAQPDLTPTAPACGVDFHPTLRR
jgi:Tol biopolymer transport system component